MDQKRVGAFMKELRKGKGLTQEQLAEQFGVSGRTVSRWETGSNLPDISLLIEISEYYHVDILEILNGERRNEKMTAEEKERIQKVADYADAEKATLLQRVRIVSIVGLISLFLGLMMQLISSNSMIPVYEYVKGMCLGLVAGALITMVLYTTGILARIAKIKEKSGQMKKIAIVCLAVVVFSLIASIIASII